MKPAWTAIKTKARNRRFSRCSGKRRVLDGCAVYTDHINTPRLVTLVNNPLNPVPLSDTSNDLAQTNGDAIQGISPLAMPVWQMAYSPFGVDLANGYEARPTTINNNFKPDLWEWLGLPTIGGAGNWSWYAGGGNGQANTSVLTAPVLNIRYPGQYYDSESGLSQNWWRSYDARMGRYTQNDPIGLEGGMNRFAYVAGDGVNKEDRKGLKDAVDLSWKFWKKWDAYQSCKEAYEKGKDAAERDERAACKRDKEAEERRDAEDRTIGTVRGQKRAKLIGDLFSGLVSDGVELQQDGYYPVLPYGYGYYKYESQSCEMLLK